MKIVVTAHEDSLESKVDKSFGRAGCFILIDDQTGEVGAHPNRQNVKAAHGAGVQAGQSVADLGAEILLTGNMGPNALKTLQAASIRVFVVKEDITVAEAVSRWKEGLLEEISESTIEGKWV